LADDKDIANFISMRYSGNGNLPLYFPKLTGIPAPSSRVILAAEFYYTTGFASFTHLNMTMWGCPESASSTAATAKNKEGAYCTPQYHGSSSNRGLHAFFLDGHCELVKPPNSEWSIRTPIYGDATNGGYFYDGTQFYLMKAGLLSVQ
jgi:hypothetical protein